MVKTSHFSSTVYIFAFKAHYNGDSGIFHNSWIFVLLRGGGGGGG